MIAALEAKDMLSNSVILFTTDNGGVPMGLNDNAGSNYPLRGVSFINLQLFYINIVVQR